MSARQLGKSGVWVSRLCLGTMMVGGPTDGHTAARMLGMARAAGINFLDTADQYAGGLSERIVGRLIAPERRRWVLATKVGNRVGDDPDTGGLSRRWLRHAIDASLRRLGTDYVDLWYLHLADRRTPLEETIAALGDIIRAGKVLHWGFSNFFGWQIGEMVRLADALGVPRPIAAQPYYNAMNRMPEVDYLPACGHYGIGVVPYSPVARGVLTGKYEVDAAPPADSRAGRRDARMMETEFRRESLLLARTIKDHAESRGMTPARFAVLWVLNNPLVTSVIAGPRTVEQWQDYLGALEHAFSEEDEALIDRLVAPGHPSTPGYSDPRYPITGRPVRR
ncbi:MAG: aldo/keto reductase [Alphaproteobacteria bacterium]|jgi:aryl-alcohol dehydrogenase (NADP+)|nr:aldo/keto reductase [Alphaproteobacteria bacterium]